MFGVVSNGAVFIQRRSHSICFTRAQGIPNSDTQVLQLERIGGVCCSPRHSALRSAVAAEVRLPVWKRWTEGAVDSKRVCHWQQGLHWQGLWVTQVFALLHQLTVEECVGGCAPAWCGASLSPHGVSSTTIQCGWTSELAGQCAY